MIVCPHCKTEQMKGTMFCSECGWDLQTSAPKGREFDLGELFATPIPTAPPAMPAPPNPVSRRNATNPRKQSTPDVKSVSSMPDDFAAYTPQSQPPAYAPAPPAFMPPTPVGASAASPMTGSAAPRAKTLLLPDLSFIVLNSGRVIESPKYEKVTIGRGDPDQDAAPDIDLTQDKGAELGVSRRHAVLTFQEEGVYLTDLGSTNRTFINRKPLPKGQPQELHNGDEIRLGNIILKTIFSGDHYSLK